MYNRFELEALDFLKDPFRFLHLVLVNIIS